MLKYIDRQLVLGYVKAYFVCVTSMLSLYIVVDLFTNLDEFTHHKGLLDVVKHIGTYYGLKIPQIFDRLCEAIVLLAGMFTIAWMQRSNELLPLLSAGISTRRVVAPILATAGAFLSLTVLNQEVVIPRIGNQLMVDKDDLDNTKEVMVTGQFEPNGIHIEGGVAYRKDQLVRPFYCLIRENVLRTSVHLSAQEARYVPPDKNRDRSGGWLLTGTQPAELEGLEQNKPLERIDPGKYFLKTTEVDFEALTRPRNWFQVTSTKRLYDELQRPDAQRLAPIAVLFHMRLTRPILGLILVVLGLSIILRDQNRNVFISAGMCLVLCALFFATCFACRQLGENEILSPALAAWLPVIGFGPLAFVMFDAVHT